jgi:adenosylcobinamide-phosphate synthase
MTSSLLWPQAAPLLLFVALLLDAALGEMRLLFRFLPHPVVVIGRAIAALDRKLNRAERGENARRVRGLVVALIVPAGAAAFGWALHELFVLKRWGWIAEAFVLAVLLAQRSLFQHVLAVARALRKDGVIGGRRAVAHIVGRDPASLDEHGVARAAIESLFENFSDAVVAPVFWYVLLGLPGAFALKAINTLDSMIGHRSDRHRAFGEAAARLDTIVMFLPARLAAAFIAIAAIVTPQANPITALRTCWRDAGKHRSVNAGWPEAAGAGALDLALAGPRRYAGDIVNDAWIGSGRARATAADIHRALQLFAVACIVHAIVAVAYLILRHG